MINLYLHWYVLGQLFNSKGYCQGVRKVIHKYYSIKSCIVKFNLKYYREKENTVYRLTEILLH